MLHPTPNYVFLDQADQLFHNKMKVLFLAWARVEMERKVNFEMFAGRKVKVIPGTDLRLPLSAK